MNKDVDGHTPDGIERRQEPHGVRRAEPENIFAFADHHERLPRPKSKHTHRITHTSDTRSHTTQGEREAHARTKKKKKNSTVDVSKQVVVQTITSQHKRDQIKQTQKQRKEKLIFHMINSPICRMLVHFFFKSFIILKSYNLSKKSALYYFLPFFQHPTRFRITSNSSTYSTIFIYVLYIVV